MRISFFLCVLFLLSRLGTAQGINPELTKSLQTKIDAQYPALDTLYKHLHANPELSLAEEKTAARIAEELKGAKCEVTTGIGGHGVVGVMKNGGGPVLMVRADMDALPIVEMTKLPYAS